MEKNLKTSSTMILIGGILELLIAVSGVVVIAFYLGLVSPELLEQLNLTESQGVAAVFGFYAITALHLIMGIVALVCKRKVQVHMPLIIGGFLLIVLSYAFMNWDNVKTTTLAINTLPGALIAGGGMIRKKNLAK